MNLFWKIVLLFQISIVIAQAFELLDLTGKVTLISTLTNDGIHVSIRRGGINYVSGTIAPHHDFTNTSDCEKLNCTFDNGNVKLIVNPIENGFQVVSESPRLDVVLEDNWDLDKVNSNWYGGPEKYRQEWPIETLKINGSNPYVIIKGDNTGVAEPYWLSSKGLFFYVDRRVPLFLDQNVKYENRLGFFAKAEPPYINRKRVVLNYTIGALDDPRKAHLFAVNNFMKKPLGHPDERMIRAPIWTTWAKYKSKIDDTTVVNFAKDIASKGYTGGQIEIDDKWEPCYGTQTFKTDSFPNIENTVKTIKSLGYRVTLWAHPFVNDECNPLSKEGKDKGYYVKDTSGNDRADWWDGSNAHLIDFTNPDAQNWYLDRLRKLQVNPGIDSFKFDAGETDYVPKNSVYKSDAVELYPRILSEQYLRTVAKFGGLIEVRSGSSTQDLPIFVRMLDKGSSWDLSNGLHSLITTLLQLNMNGYGMVLPDMVGGNGYDKPPSAELLVRWAQANTFMPTLQFSYLPWDITSDKFKADEIVDKYIKLHEKYADEIIRAMHGSMFDGSPVNPPIWWVDPTDREAHKINDEYLVGSKILVAPVIQENATGRDVYLPFGQWQDGNNGKIYNGPVWIKNYPAPIEILPYFILLNQN